MNNESRILTCVYCGQEYSQDTPSWGSQVLTDHIKVCEKHPMRQLEIDKAKLRKALSDLVGVESEEALGEIELVLRRISNPAKETSNLLNAIRTLQNVR